MVDLSLCHGVLLADRAELDRMLTRNGEKVSIHAVVVVDGEICRFQVRSVRHINRHCHTCNVNRCGLVLDGRQADFGYILDGRLSVNEPVVFDIAINFTRHFLSLLFAYSSK